MSQKQKVSMKSKDVSLLVTHFQTSQEVTGPTFFPQLLLANDQSATGHGHLHRMDLQPQYPLD